MAVLAPFTSIKANRRVSLKTPAPNMPGSPADPDRDDDDVLTDDEDDRLLDDVDDRDWLDFVTLDLVEGEDDGEDDDDPVSLLADRDDRLLSVTDDRLRLDELLSFWLTLLEISSGLLDELSDTPASVDELEWLDDSLGEVVESDELDELCCSLVVDSLADVVECDSSHEE